VLAQLFTVPWITPINCSTYCLSMINRRSALAWGCITDRICIYCLLFPGVAIAHQDFKHICIAYLQNWLQITVAWIKLLITVSSFAQLLHWHWLCSRLNLHWLPNLPYFVWITKHGFQRMYIANKNVNSRIDSTPDCSLIVCSPDCTAVALGRTT